MARSISMSVFFFVCFFFFFFFFCFLTILKCVCIRYVKFQLTTSIFITDFVFVCHKQEDQITCLTLKLSNRDENIIILSLGKKVGELKRYSILLAAPCENVSSGICGQRRPRSACASAQSYQGRHCPLTESLYIT